MGKYDAQTKWQQQAGLVSKSYKLPKNLIDNFADTCKKQNESQAFVLRVLMQNYIDNSK